MAWRNFSQSLLRCENLESRRLLAVVTSAADNGPGTLRDALAGADPTITFDVAAMGTDTIVLTTGDLVVNRDVAIDGDDGMGGRVTIDGGGTYRVLMTDYVGGNYADQSFSNMVITNGYSASDGGGIQSFENLTLDNVLVTENYSLNDAGGIGFGDENNAAGDLIITNSAITNNFAVDDGGGIDFYNGRLFDITDSEISGNTVGRANEANTAGGKVGGGGRFIDTLAAHPGGQVFNLTNVTVADNLAQGQASATTVASGSGNGILFTNLSEYFGNNSLPATVRIVGGTVSGNTDAFTDVDPNDGYAPNGSGGGLNFNGVTDLVVDGTVFDNNYAYGNGSGIVIGGGFGQTETALGDVIRAQLNGVTMTNHGNGPNGGAVGLGGAIDAIEYGNVYINIEVEINDSVITGNTANFGGGVVSRQGVEMTINNSEISGNFANGSGGGLYMLAFGENGVVNVNGSTIADNMATYNGAGVLLRDNTPYATTFNLNNSTVSGNVGIGNTTDPMYQDLGDGGGIFNSGILLNVNQSTISYNQSPTDGGGIFIEYTPADVNIRQSTIYGNSADRDDGGAGNGVGAGGGVALDVGNFYGVNITNTVVSGNSTPAGADEIYDSVGYVNTNNSFVGAGAMLGPLQLNAGGTTLTHEPLAGSPLIDAGDDLLAPFSTDQNGGNRVNDAAVDLGSVEAGNGVIAPCDFNGDGVCDLDDLDALTVESGMGTNDLAFDLNNDGVVDRTDVQQWLVAAGARPENTALTGGNPFLEGDANLDGAVDGADFIAWNSAKFTNDKLWSTGNFDANGATDGSDFILWNMFKFQSSMSPAVIDNGPIRSQRDGSAQARVDGMVPALQPNLGIPNVAAPRLLPHLVEVMTEDRGATRTDAPTAADLVFSVWGV